MSLIKYLLVFFLCLSFATNAQIRFRHIRVRDGLSQSGVNTVIKDRNGFYWIGTQYGINRYDGKNIKQYFVHNTPGVSDNYIFCSIEDAYGNILFGTRNYITKYNITTNDFSTIVIHDSLLRFNTEKFTSITSFAKDDRGNVCFSVGNKVMQIPLEESHKPVPVLKIAETTIHTKRIAPFFFKNYLYAFSEGSKFIYKYKLPLQKKLLPCDSIIIPGNVTSDFFDIYITSPMPVIKINETVYKLEKDSLIQVFKEASSNAGILSCVYSTKEFHVGTYNGLYMYSDNFLFEKIFTHSDDNPLSLGDNKIYSISDTKDGLLWYGNSVEGVNVFDTKNQCFEIVKPFEDKPYNALSCFLKNDSTLLIGTLMGLDEFKKRNSKWQLYKKDVIANYKITTICYGSNALVFGTTNGLYALQNNKEVKKINLLNANPYVYDLKNVSGKQIIVSSSHGFHVLNSSTYSVEVNYSNAATDRNGKKPVLSYYVLSTSINRNKEYTVNTVGGSTLLDSNYQFKSNYFKKFRYSSPMDLFISKSINDENGTIWFSSMSNGVYKYQKKHFTIYNEKNGLSHNMVSSIETDSHKNLWASTNKGINCIRNNGIIETFINQLELETPEFYLNGSIEKNNQLFFCSTRGLITFNSDTVLERFGKSEKMSLNLNTVIKNYTDTVKSEANEIVLKQSDKMLLLNFSVPTYRYFNQLKLSYQLQGFDDAWHPVVNGGDFMFTNLPYGNYVLTVKAALPQLNWKAERKINIIVLAPFWRATWFLIICVVLAIILVAMIVWYISYRKYKQKLIELQIHQKIHEERERISNDLHDNIGSHISHLINGLEFQQQEKQSKDIHKLTGYARSALSELRETIWVLKTEDVTVSELDYKIKNLVFELREQYQTIDIKHLSKITTPHKLSATLAITFFRILQETINNSIKHSSCSTISIDFVSEVKGIFLLITDNGIGFDTSNTKIGHYGLENMKDRAEQAGMAYHITSKINNGTQVEVTYMTA